MPNDGNVEKLSNLVISFSCVYMDYWSTQIMGTADFRLSDERYIRAASIQATAIDGVVSVCSGSRACVYVTSCRSRQQTRYVHSQQMQMSTFNCLGRCIHTCVSEVSVSNLTRDTYSSVSGISKCRQILGYQPEPGHLRFLPHPCQFMIL